MEIIQSIVGFIIAIGILVTFHEFGHFYIARLFGVKVLNFSIGFGKTIYKKQFHPDSTEYSVGLVPLGGYVKMLESSEVESSTPEKLHKYCFDKQSVYKKFLIVAAGPVFNLILAVIFFTFVHFAGIAGMKPYVSSIDGFTIANSLDDKIEIISVNNISAQRWQDVRVEILNSIINGEKISLQLKNNDVITAVDIDYDKNILQKEGDILNNIGLKPTRASIPAVIGSIEKNSPASLAGLKISDNVLSINNNKITDWNSFTDLIKKNPDNILQLKVLRNNINENVILVPVTKEKDGVNYGYAGISPDVTSLNDFSVLVKYPLGESFIKSLMLTYDYSVLTFKMIFELFTGNANMNNISGPLSIAEFSGKSLSMGIVYFAYLLAILSISLGVLNLLPIPVLDGGHLVYYIIEMIVGRPVPEKVQLIAQQFGLLILFGIMIIAFYNDFMRIL